MAGEDVGDQRLRILDQKAVFIRKPLSLWEKGRQDTLAVFTSEPFIKPVCGKHDPFIKILHQLADLLHMCLSVSTAEKSSAGSEDTADFLQDGGNIIAVKKHVIGDHQIKAFVLAGDFSAVKGPERKPGIRGTDGSSGIAEHTAGNIGKCDGDILRQKGKVVGP